MTRKQLAGVGAACLVLLAPHAAGAQGQRDTTTADSTRRLERVVVRAAREPATVGGAGAVVLRPDSLRTAPAPSLGDALREMPFVLVRQNSRGEAELSVRGSESRQAAVLLDGVPLSLGWDNRADASLVPLSGVQRIMLVRGLSSLLHGPNVLGGIVELGTGGEARGERRGAVAWAGAGFDDAGAHALSLGGMAPVAAGGGSLVMRAGGGLRERRGFRVPAGAGDGAANGRRTNSDLQLADAFAALRWQDRTGRHAGITATGYRAERGIPPELHVAEPRLWRQPLQSRALAVVSAGSGPMTTGLGTALIDASAGYTRGESEIESYADRAYTILDARELGAERTATARVIGRHTLGAAGELRAAVTVSGVNYVETIGDTPPSRYAQRLSSAGVEVEWPVLARGSVAGGIVHDAASTPETGGKPPLGRMSAVGWRGGVTYEASATTRLHASASRRSRFPALRELYSGSLDRFQPNPGLRAERLTGAEAGVTYEAASGSSRGVPGALTVQGVAFHHRLYDAVVRTTVPGTRRFVRVNRDEIRSAGIELLGEWRSSAGERAVSLGGDLLAQGVRVRDDSAGAERRPEHQPELRGSLNAGVPLVWGVRGSGGVRYTGVQYCVHPDTDAQVRLAGAAQASVSLERRWGFASRMADALRVVLALDNVTDAAVHDQCGLPQPGRTLRLGVRLG